MAAVPLLKEEPMGSEDGYDRREDLSSDRRKRLPLLRTANIGWAVLCAGLLGLTVGIAAGVAILVVQSWNTKSETCISRTAGPSPVTRDLDITYHTEQFNGSLMMENIYRLPGSPEVDAAWEALGVNYRPLRVPYDVGLEIGLSPDQVKLQKQHGGGFPANVEGLHHLHCANLVRQALYYNIDYYRDLGTGAFQNEPHIVQKHVSHCLDVIRQQLMCTVDIGVLGQVWFQPGDSDVPEPFVDFNTKHVCRNFDAIRQWAEERQMPEEVPDDLIQPPEPGDYIYDHVP
ncbi:unnamed protein product [Zymoseptoria tritici ST99CH_3D1]|nr:unnamed protein product [Zymoseptoria tritici ST99CH_3D1]